MLIGATLIALGYLFGSLATAVVVSRLMGLPDPREGGSGNPGATNVLRLGGKLAAALTLLGDVLKGVAPVLLAGALSANTWVVAGAALAAFLGHLYPLYFGFKGGKGVATALGAALALAWPVALGLIATWVGVAVASRYSSLGSLAAAAAAPVLGALLTGEPAIVTALGAMSVLLFWRHRANIRRLLDGSESRIGDRAGKSESQGQI